MDNTSFIPITERLEMLIIQIGNRLSADGRPMHQVLQRIIDDALNDWSDGPEDRSKLELLVATRITVPGPTTYVPVIRLEDMDEPVEPPPDWPQTW